MGMSKKQYGSWERTRGQGKQSFVWKYGVMYWGITTAILFLLLTRLIFHDEWEWRRLILVLISFPITGYFWGICFWHVSEKKFHNYKANDRWQIDTAFFILQNVARNRLGVNDWVTQQWAGVKWSCRGWLLFRRRWCFQCHHKEQVFGREWGRKSGHRIRPSFHPEQLLKPCTLMGRYMNGPCRNSFRPRWIFPIWEY